MNTGLHDKTGRAIYVGDIVQHRLGKFGKSGGSKNFRVIQFGKNYHLVDEFAPDPKYGGMKLTEKLCEFLVVTSSLFIR